MTFEEIETMNNERNGGRWSLLSVVLCVVIAVLVHAFCGCATKGAKVVEGVDFTAGVNIPAAEGMAELSLVNYLSGFRLSADRNYGLNCEFESTNTFSFAFGLYESWGVKRFKARCRPCWTNMPPSAVRKTPASDKAWIKPCDNEGQKKPQQKKGVLQCNSR